MKIVGAVRPQKSPEQAGGAADGRVRHHEKPGDGHLMMPGVALSLRIGGPPAGRTGAGRQEERGPPRNESRAGPCSSCGFQTGGGPNRALPCQAEASGEGGRPSPRMGAISTVPKVPSGEKTGKCWGSS